MLGTVMVLQYLFCHSLALGSYASIVTHHSFRCLFGCLEIEGPPNEVVNAVGLDALAEKVVPVVG
jgi:hypothetical protein